MKIIFLIFTYFALNGAQATSTAPLHSMEDLMASWKGGATGFCPVEGTYKPEEIEKFKTAVLLMGFGTEFTEAQQPVAFCLFILCPGIEGTPYRLANEQEMWKYFDREPSTQRERQCHRNIQPASPF